MAEVGLIHATPLAIPPVRDAFARLWPEARLLNLLDEGLLAVLEADGSIGPRATDRMLRIVGLVRDSGAGVIQLAARTLTSPTLAVETARRALGGR